MSNVPLSEFRIAEIQSQLNDTQRARDMITMLGDPKWPADRPKAPFITAIEDLLAEVRRQQAEITLLKAQAEGAVSLLSSVQQEYIALKQQTPSTSEPDYRQLIINFCAGLTLSDHMGDVADDVVRLLDLAHIEVDEWSDLDDLRKILGLQYGATYLGTNESVIDDEEDEEDDEEYEEDN